MRIALLGTRGIPAKHGGFETCVEEIGKRLVQKGHLVTVYSKKSDYLGKEYLGMRIVRVPRLPLKGVETLVATTLAVVHSLFQNFDMHMVFDNANSPCLLLYKMFRKTCAINTDGLGWKREKWGPIARAYYKWSEWAAVRLCENMVTDSQAMHNYYQREYRASSTVIEYGAYIPSEYSPAEVGEVLRSYGLTAHRYILQVTRFEPENNPLLTLQAFDMLTLPLQLVVVGGAGRATAYSATMRTIADNNRDIILPGFIYNKKLLEIIWTHALCYIHGNSVGGTNPALLQAMAAGRPVLALDCEFNRETLGGHGLFYSRSAIELKEKVEFLYHHMKQAEHDATHATDRIKSYYNWERITEEYERLFLKLTKCY